MWKNALLPLPLLLLLHHQGVLRIHFLEAQELLGKDKFLGGLIKGKSDPYGVIKVGTKLFKSKVIHETVNPKWNEVYEVGGGILLLLLFFLPICNILTVLCRIYFHISKCGSRLCFQALIYDHSGKNLEIELFDEDTDKDDFLGWCDRDAELTAKTITFSH